MIKKNLPLHTTCVLSYCIVFNNNFNTVFYFFSLQSHADFQTEQLNRIDNDLMQAKMVLVDITEPRRLCLRELGLRGHFVRWVKDALEGKNSYYLL